MEGTELDKDHGKTMGKPWNNHGLTQGRIREIEKIVLPRTEKTAKRIFDIVDLPQKEGIFAEF